MNPVLVVLMGVSGSGKSTVGRELAGLVHWPFYDGDDFQPQANIAKMQSGQPLTDADRVAWLDALVALITGARAKGQPLILACSALKETYRQRLQGASSDARLVFLEGTPELLQQRLQARKGHFFKADLLASQLQTLEVPQDALRVDITPSPAVIAREIKQKLNI